MRLFHILRLAIFLSCATSIACAQVTGENKPDDPNAPMTISVTSRLVVETVTVKDKSGKPIQGLSAKDFTLTEDGTPQKISFVEHQLLPEDATPMANAKGDNVTVYNRLSRTQISAESAGEVKYKDRRLLALYFDMSAMPPADQLRALDAAQKFVRTQMTPSDLLAILRYSGSSVDVLQDFTADRDRLLSILQTLVVGEGQNDSAPNSGDDSASDTGAAFGQDDSEFNIFTTDRQLAALQTAADMLGHLNEKKALIYFASGLNLNGLDNQAQLHATVDAAIRAGVSFWPIDARGLVARGPLGDATQGSQGNQSMYTGAAAIAVTSRFQSSQDTLFALAGDTGGKALLDNNDLSRGIVQAQHAISDYYIVGYYTTNTELNGKFRKIKIALNDELAANLDYRQGYYAGKTFGKFTTADKERQLEDALMLGDPITELTIALEINYFQLNRAEYFVPVMIKIPGRELALAKKRGAEQTVIDFIGEIKDVYGSTTVTNIRDHVTATLTNDTAEQLVHRPIEYSSGYTLLPGKYSIKVLARDDVTGRIGTFQTFFTIPNLNKETKQVAISSVVLSGERISYKEAIYNAAKEKEQVKQEAANPLVQGGQQLIPSVTRVFNRSRNLFVYLQAYVPPLSATQPASGSGSAAAPSAPAAQQPLVAYLSLYKDQTKVFESTPVESSANPGSRIGVTPLNFAIDLSHLQPGKYKCQLTVLDPMGQKETFWQAPILIAE